MIGTTLGEMSVSFLSVGSMVVSSDGSDVPGMHEKSNLYPMTMLSGMTGRPVTSETCWSVRRVTVSQEMFEESALGAKHETTVLYDLLELTDEAEDAGFAMVCGVPAELVREV